MKRALRIFPGLLVALLLIAFVFAPFSLLLRSGANWNIHSAAGYVIHNAFLYPYGAYQESIDSTLVGLPLRAWDGSLWTLFWEGACYAAIGFAGSVFGRGRAFTAAVTSTFFAATAVSLAHRLGAALPASADLWLPLLLAFAAGGTLSVHRTRFPLTWPVAVAAAVATAGVIAISATIQLAALPLAVLLLWLASALPFHSVGSANDLSYGVYIYAWPVQQLLTLALGPLRPVALMIPLVVALTLPLAYLSCRFVEQPALKLRFRISRTLQGVRKNDSMGTERS